MPLDALASWISSNPLLSAVVIMAASLFCLVRSADAILTSITHYARALGVSDYLIGFLVIGMGNSLPEFLSALLGNQAGEPGIALGTILGSGVTTVTIVLGLLALFGRSVDLKDRLLKQTRFLILPLCMLPLVLAADGQLSRLDGGILVAAFAWFVIMVWRSEGTFGRMKRDIPLDRIAKDAVVFTIALIILLLAARFLVSTAILVSHSTGIPAYLLALTVIALGASAPDLAVDLRSLLAGRKSIAMGGLLGGLVFEFTLALGIVALLSPIPIKPMALLPAAFFFIMPLFGVMTLVKRGCIQTKHGVWLLACYGTFLILQIVVVP